MKRENSGLFKTLPAMIPMMVLTSVTIAFSACGQNGGTNSTAAESDARAEAMNAKPLTAADKSAFQTLYKTKDLHVPVTPLYFDKYSDPSVKAADLAKLDNQGRALVDLAKTNCTVSPETTTTVGDQKTKGNTQIDTVVSAIGDNASAPGKCPLTYSSKNVITSSNSDDITNPSAPIMNRTSHTEASSTITYKDSDISSIAFANATTTSSTDTKTVLAQLDASGNISAGSMSSVAHASIQSGAASTTLRFNMSMTAGHSSQKFLYKISLPNLSTPAVIALIKTDNADTEIIVNGEKYTVENLKSDFGIDAVLMFTPPPVASH